MSHPLYEVTRFRHLGEYTLRIQFDDGTTQLVDLEPVLYGEVYGPLRIISCTIMVLPHFMREWR